MDTWIRLYHFFKLEYCRIVIWIHWSNILAQQNKLGKLGRKSFCWPTFFNLHPHRKIFLKVSINTTHHYLSILSDKKQQDSSCLGRLWNREVLKLQSVTSPRAGAWAGGQPPDCWLQQEPREPLPLHTLAVSHHWYSAHLDTGSRHYPASCRPAEKPGCVLAKISPEFHPFQWVLTNFQSICRRRYTNCSRELKWPSWTQSWAQSWTQSWTSTGDSPLSSSPGFSSSSPFRIWTMCC